MMRALILLGMLGLLLIPLPVRAEDKLIYSFQAGTPASIDTLANDLDGGACVIPTECVAAQEINTQGSNWYLTRVVFTLKRTAGPPVGTMLAILYEAGSVPGAEIERSTTRPLSDLTTVFADYQFNFLSTTRLSSGTLYWIGIANKNSTTWGGGSNGINLQGSGTGIVAEDYAEGGPQGWSAFTLNELDIEAYGIATPSSSLRDGAYFLALLMSGLTVVVAINVFQSPNEKFGKVKVKAVLVLAVITFIMFLFSRLF